MSTAQVIADSARGDKNVDKPTGIEQKDFFWDQFITYISSAILALTFPLNFYVVEASHAFRPFLQGKSI